MPMNPAERERLKKELVGQRFGRLVVLHPVDHTTNGRTRYKCICDCGTVKEVDKRVLASGQSRSCGCYRVERNRTQGVNNATHGQTDHPLHKAWRAMIARCTQPNHPDYKNYGGRGIGVCERWMDSWEAFYEDMGPRPPRHSIDSIDRIDNNGNYNPENCRWATRGEQARNQRRNHMIEFGGESMCVTDWADRLGVDYTSLLSRLRSGWTAEEAITTPFAKRKSVAEEK